jgi:hypothetical protein
LWLGPDLVAALSGALSGDVPGTFGPAIGDCGGAAVALPIPRRGEIMTNRFLFAAAETIITRQWRRAGQWRVSPMGQDMSARYFKDEAATGALACAAATALLLVLGAPARADECADLRAKLEQIQGQIAVEESMVRSYSDIANDSDKNAKKAYDRASASNKRDDWTTYYYFEANHKRDLTYVAEDKATLAKYQSDAADVQKAIAFVCPDTPPAPPPTKADAPPAPNNPPASPSSAGGTDTTTPTSPVTPTADTPLPPSAPTTPTTTAATPAPLPPVQVGPTETTTGFNVPPPTDSGGPTDQPSPSPEPLPVAALPPVMLPAAAPSDPGNLPAVWCVMRNGTQKTVSRCDDTTGAGMGWTLVDTNLTWPAATLEAFGATTSPGPAYRPSTPSGSPATIAGLGVTGPLNAPPPGPSGSFPPATPRAGDSAECTTAQQYFEAARDVYNQLTTLPPSPDKTVAIQQAQMLSGLVTQLNSARSSMDAKCGFQIGNKWFPPKWQPGTPPFDNPPPLVNRPPPTIQVNAPPPPAPLPVAPVGPSANNCQSGTVRVNCSLTGAIWGDGQGTGVNGCYGPDDAKEVAKNYMDTTKYDQKKMICTIAGALVTEAHADVLPVAPLPLPVVTAVPQVDVAHPPAKTHQPATPRVTKHPAAPSHPNEQPAQSIDPAAAAAAISILGGMMGGGGFRGGGGGGGGHPCHR